jgi:hypothetical protein
MTRFTFDLATPADDAPLRELLRSTAMRGRISVAFAREPSYFGAAAVDGPNVQVGVARERPTGRVIGMGSRTVGMRYVNGERVPVGYLSGLRLLPEFRGHAAILARGYRFLRELHADRQAPYYLTTIAADNDATVRVLTSSRAGLPVYHPCGTYCTLSLATRAAPVNGNHKAVAEIRSATVKDREALLRFLHECGPARNFFPAYEASDLFTGGGLLRGLAPDDILLALREGRIIGTLGCWYQRSFKQIVVQGYDRWLGAARPLYNAWQTFRRHPTLPAIGETVTAHLAAIPVVRDNDPALFRLLLNKQLRQLAMNNHSLLLLGLHDTDPLLPIAREFSGREYVTNLYIVYWSDETPDLAELTTRVPYLELGAL